MFWIFIAIVWVIAVGVGAWLIFHSYPDPDRIDVKRQPYRVQGLLTVGAASVDLRPRDRVLQLRAGQYGSRRRGAHVRPHLGSDRAGHLADRALADL